MPEQEKIYLPRVTDPIIKNKLSGLGGLIIADPKRCKKTTTAEQFAKSALYLDVTDEGTNYSITASFNPAILLEGKTPRLIDEWQLAPELFGATRRAIDKRATSGQFIFTGSNPMADGEPLRSN